jgi:hypothetical protein
MIIPKNMIFGVFTIIDQIILGIPLKREVRYKKGKLFYKTPNLRLLAIIKNFDFDSQKTSYGHL